MTARAVAMQTPGLVIAAPRSGGGKTTVTLGLLAALAARGVRVQPFKCGPDYIDPAFHAAAAGRPSFNLDSWAMRRGTVAGILAGALSGAELGVCEGVMGLFDGVAVTGAWGTGATADIVAATGWPVLLVLDVSGQAQTAAAVALGCATLRPDVRVAGVILNRVGSERHRRLAASGLAAIGLPVLGALPRRDDLSLPERHLGLVQAGETEGLGDKLAALGAFVAAHVDLAAVEALACPVTVTPPPRGEGPGVGWSDTNSRGFRPPPGAPAPASPQGGGGATTGGDSGAGRDVAGLASTAALSTLPPPGQRIALAQDAAFSFIYPHLLSAWRAAGAEIVPFSPLANESPDPAADSVWLPGGYPELHAGRLAAAGQFLGGLRAAAAAGTPVHGECGGFMVLGTALTDAKGVRHPMAGLLAVETSFAARKLHLGYRQARLNGDCVLGRRSEIIRGHEFHYATLLRQDEAPLAAIADAEGTPVAETGAVRGRVSGSFFHAIDVA